MRLLAAIGGEHIDAEIWNCTKQKQRKVLKTDKTRRLTVTCHNERIDDVILTCSPDDILTWTRGTKD